MIAYRDKERAISDTILNNFEISYRNKAKNDNKNNIASIAEAKFGFPRVDIIELYGLFHFLKSLPDICMTPYTLIKAQTTIAVL